MSELLDRVLEAHGGRERWAAVRRIRARVRTGGLLVRTRMPASRLSDYVITAEAHEPVASAAPFPDPGARGVFDRGEVRIETDDGEVLESRADPRPLFFGRSGLRRNLRWDRLDTVYFAGYAMWNYLTTPGLLDRDDVRVREIDPWDSPGGRWRRLEARFPPGLDTHSERQVLYYDERFLLRRHDYVAEVVGRWARAAHMCDDHVEAGGVVFPARRWVRPIGLANRALPGPDLVTLRLSGIEVS